VSDLFSPATCERFGRVKVQYDPGNLIRSTHPIPTVQRPARAAQPVLAPEHGKLGDPIA
jgi:hypothetical protein